MGLTPWKGKDSRNRGSRGLAGRAGGVMVIVSSAVTQETVVCGEPPTGDSKASMLRKAAVSLLCSGLCVQLWCREGQRRLRALEPDQVLEAPTRSDNRTEDLCPSGRFWATWMPTHCLTLWAKCGVTPFEWR